MVEELVKIRDKLDIVEVERVEQMKFDIAESLPTSIKRCILEVER